MTTNRPLRPHTVTLSDDKFFYQFGDMLTPNKLRELDLSDPEDIALRDKYLTEYAHAGIADDQDPGEVTFDLVTEPDETPEELAAHAKAIAEHLLGIRHTTPADFEVPE